VDLSRNRPTIGALLVAFVTALASWGWSFIPETVPGEVRVTGYALVLAVVAAVVGKIVQGEWFVSWFGDTAPWAADTHAAAVAYALTLDPDEHPLYAEQVDEQLRALGIRDLTEARARLGLD
jgi:hypothetical protein